MRGQITSTMLFSVVKYSFAVIIVLVLRAIIPYAMVLTVDTTAAEQNLFINQLMTTPQGLVLERYGYPNIGVIDPAKISTMQQRIVYGHKLAAKVILSNLTDTLKAEGSFQEDWYNLWMVLVGKKGPGGTFREQKTYYVLYPEGNSLVPGKLTIDVVMPHG